MKNKISYKSITDLLVGDSSSVEELKVLLNFISHIGSVINHLIVTQEIKSSNKVDTKFLKGN